MYVHKDETKSVHFEVSISSLLFILIIINHLLFNGFKKILIFSDVLNQS